MKIELKDLVWKDDPKEKEFELLAHKYNAICGLTPYAILKIYAKDYIKEKAEILNKDPQYTKDDIIEMFVEAGFEWDKSSHELIHETNNLRLRLCFGIGYNVWFRLDVVRLDDNIQSVVFNFNDRKQIEFYYNKFREILEFEVENAV